MVQRIISFIFILLLAGCKPKPVIFLSHVQLYSPADNAAVFENNVPFTWDNVYVHSNWLQIASDINFTNILLDSVCPSTTANYDGTSVFTFNTTYYWRIKAEPQAGEIFYSDVRKFKIIDSRDSLKGTYNAQIHAIKWNSPSTDTTFQATVVISKVNPDKLHVVCAAIGWLPDMLPYPDNNCFHYGDDGLVPADSAFKSCIYDTLLSRISLEYYSGTVNPGYHYWFTIYK